MDMGEGGAALGEFDECTNPFDNAAEQAEEFKERTSTYDEDISLKEEIKAGKGSNKGVNKADDFTKKSFVPEKYWTRNAPDFNTPGSKITQFKNNKGVIEKSTAIYDDFGRQQYRIDYNNHGYKDHSIPHLHERTFGPGLDPEFGKETRYDWWR